MMLGQWMPKVCSAVFYFFYQQEMEPQEVTLDEACNLLDLKLKSKHARKGRRGSTTSSGDSQDSQSLEEAPDVGNDVSVARKSRLLGKKTAQSKHTDKKVGDEEKQTGAMPSSPVAEQSASQPETEAVTPDAGLDEKIGKPGRPKAAKSAVSIEAVARPGQSLAVQHQRLLN